MIGPTTQALRYDREVSPEGADTLSEIARRITPGSCVLDIGASTGALGRFLAATKQCVVDGIEGDPACIDLARPNYRRIFDADLDQADLAEILDGSRYDVVVCADVLEHLRNPALVLRQLRGILLDGGRVFASIPNVAYVGVMVELLCGQFQYRPVGLLDSTHLRFFTRASILDLFASSGYRVDHIDPFVLPLERSEFGAEMPEHLPPLMLQGLLGQPDALTYQFIIEALPGASTTLPAPPPNPLPVPLRYSVQLFWRLQTEESFSPSRCATTYGLIGVERQKLRLPIPPLCEPPEALRLDLADRPGFIHLEAVHVRNSDGSIVWRWDGRGQPPFGRGSMHELVSVPKFRDGLFVATGSDPHVELPIPKDGLSALVNGGVIELCCGWPASGDYFATKMLLDENEARMAARESAVTESIRGFEASLVRESAGLRERARDYHRALEQRLDERSYEASEDRERLALQLTELDDLLRAVDMRMDGLIRQVSSGRSLARALRNRVLLRLRRIAERLGIPPFGSREGGGVSR